MRPPALAVALAVLCVLAGCNAFAPGTDTDSATGDDPTVTPADVPRDPEDGTLAPGLSETGLVDANALYEAHRSALADRPLRVDRLTAMTYRGRVVDETNETAWYGPDRKRTLVDAAVGGVMGSTVDNYGLFSTGNGTFERRVVDGRVRYFADRQNVRTGRERLNGRLEDLRNLLYRLDVDRVETVGERDGVTVYRIVGSDPDANEVPDDGGTTGIQPEVTVDVDERGTVHSVRTVEEVRLNAESVQNVSAEGEDEYVVLGRVQTVTFDASVGTPSSPAWVADARETVSNREFVAPGLTTDGVVDANRLDAAHRAAVESTSMRVEADLLRRANGTVRNHYRERIVVDRANGTRLWTTTDTTEEWSRTRWWNGSEGYRRYVQENATSYDAVGGPRPLSAASPEFPPYVEFADTSVEALGNGSYRVVVTDLPRVSYYPTVTERLAFVVAPNGLITQYSTTFRTGNGLVSTRSFTLDPGPTTVPRPDWLDTARNATG
ncbi:hypothetical protein [Halomarina oriensis]|uniref:Lipoprotein n=1 Tax=Halomarina oriensis TaxID=671145 RepID=A0A6B0GJV5_9EURY|nr:hypothetical protein [Halomarina oriensis]MWG34880.1 hypothetical protein [Halomarina oriensis]